MPEGAPQNTQTIAQVRSASVGALSGILAAVIWTNWPALAFSQSSAVQLACISLAFSALAGFIAAVFMPLDSPETPDVVSVTARAGLRSGLIAALVCAGAILAAFVTKTFNAPTRIDDLVLRAITWHTAIILLAAFFASVPAGVAGSLAGLIWRRPEIAAQLTGLIGRSRRTITSELEQAPLDWSIRFTRGLIFLSVFGILSPLLLLFRDVKIDPPPVAATPPAKSKEAPSAIPQSPPSPPFRYSKPDEFDLAKPGQITIFTRKNLSSLAPDKPLAFSPDSRLFAYILSNAGAPTVAVMNLDAFEVSASFVLPEIPEHFSWSPESNRVFYVIRSKESRMGVINLQTRSTIELPRPKNRDLPGGPCRWWADDEVAFYPDDEPALSLNLDTLLLRELKDVAKFTAGDTDLRKLLKAAPTIAFPSAKGWRMDLAPSLLTIIPPPRKTPSDKWTFNGPVALAFRDVNKEILRTLPAITFDAGDRFLASSDGSKLMLLNGGHSEIIYFVLRPDVSPSFTAKMPRVRDKIMSDPALAAVIDAQQLCAFAYSPLINPLNGKTVGPDRTSLRALLRIAKWEGETAELWVAESFQDIRSGDVIADFHTRERGQITPVKNLADIEWAEPLIIHNEADRITIPTSGSGLALEKLLTIQTTADTYTMRFDKISLFQPSPKETPPLFPTPPKTMETPKLIDSKPAVSEIPGMLIEIHREKIDRFVAAHHANASAGKIAALMADYEGVVDYLDKQLERDEIRKEEEEYHRKWNKVVETLEGETRIMAQGAYLYVNYTIVFRAESTAENRWISGKNDIELQLKETAAGFAITKQTAKIRDRHEGVLAATKAASTSAAPPKKDGPPPDGTDLPKPRWAGKLGGVAGARYQTAHALHFGPNGAVFHETSLVVEDNGQIRKWCRREVHGQVSRQGNSFFVRFDKQGWTSGSDQVLAQSLAGYNYVGQQVQFDISGEDLIEHRTERVLIKLSPVP